MQIMDIFSKSLSTIRRTITSRERKKINGLVGRKTMNNLKMTLTCWPF